MHTEPTTQPVSTPPPPSAYYCNCAIPLAVERAERHGAAIRVCTRCEQPIAVSMTRW
jgi:hypothetical protein